MMQPQDVPGFCFKDGRALEGRGTIILHINAPLMPLAMLRLGRRLMRDIYVIGYWVWELPEVSPDWRHGIPYVHEIWVPSTFTADAIRPIAGGRPVHVVPHPVAFDRPPVVRPSGPANRPFTILTLFNVASSFQRKNPLATIAAFRTAVGDDPDVRLIIKTSNFSVYPKGLSLLEEQIGSARNITLLRVVLPPAKIDVLYTEIDVVMSLHRSEGFGLILAEAMMRGLPVIATDWSGNVDFVTNKTGIPVPCRLVLAEDPQGTYHYPKMVWADADVGAAAEALRCLRTNPDLAQRLGLAGAALAADEWCAESYGARVRGRLGLKSEVK